jgi:hypothetical protein
VGGQSSIEFTGSARYASSRFVRTWGISYSYPAILQFVEDEGSVVFYKNAYGLAAASHVMSDGATNDSGIEIDA